MATTSVKKNVLINTIYQMLIIIVPFITVPYVSRILGPDGIGVYSYTRSIVSYFVMFSALGTMAYGTREIAMTRNDKRVLSSTFWEIETLSCITSLICIAIWLIFAVLYHTYTIYFNILTILIVNTMFDISWLYAGLEKFKYTVSVNSIFKILGIIAVFVFIKKPDDVGKYIFITTMTTLLGTISMWLFLPRIVLKPDFKNLKLRKHFKETLIYFIPTIATSIYTVLDKTLIGLITNNLSENGYYEQATKIIEVCKTLTFYSLNMVLSSRISYLYVQKKYDEIKKRIEVSINYILFASIGIIFGLIAVSDIFVNMFFGNEFVNVSAYIKCLSPVILLIGISNCIGSQYYTPVGLRKKSAHYIIIGSIVNLVLNIILIPKFWGYGAIVATIIAETVITTLYIRNCNGIIYLAKLFELCYTKLISGMVMFVSIMLISRIHFSSDIIKLVILVFLGIIIYISCLLILKDSFVYGVYNNQIKPSFYKLIKKEK